MEGSWNPKKRVAAGEDHQALANMQEEDDRGNENDVNGACADASQNLFFVDYSKNGKAKCNRCKKLIPKDELRIGKLVPFKVGHIKKYFHVNCSFLAFRRARLASNLILDMSVIDGLDNITEEERKNLSKSVDDLKSFWNERPERIRKTNIKTSILDDPAPKSRIRPCSTPALKVMFTNADQLTSTKMVELKSRIIQENHYSLQYQKLNQKMLSAVRWITTSPITPYTQ